MIEVSVIIPAYNQDKFIEETLKSVLAQTYKNFECIIVDDGSTDDTKAVAGKYIDRDKIKYFYQENKGLAGARNTGLKLAKGKYIHFLDSDDLICNYFLEHMVGKLNHHKDIDVLSCAWVLIDEAGRRISSKIGPAKSDNYLQDLILQNLFPVHAVMARRDIIDSAGLFSESLSALEDWDMWLRIAMNGCRFDVLDEVVVRYRRQKESMTLDISRMIKNLHLFLNNLCERNLEFKKYKKYTYIFQMLKFYLYAEEAGDISYQKKITKEVGNLWDDIKYDHYYFKKFYEVIRNIRNGNVKLNLCKNIYSISPDTHRSFWKMKILKLKIKKRFQHDKR